MRDFDFLSAQFFQFSMAHMMACLLATEDEGDENSFESLREAMKEYWTTMKEYYKAVRSLFPELFGNVIAEYMKIF